MEPSTPNPPAWGPVKRLLFRFVFFYLVLYTFPFPLNVIPVYGQILEQPYTDLWDKAVPWVGERVFGVEVKYRPLGSGDTTYNYVQLFCYLILTLAAVAVWTVLDRKRADYARLNEWLRVYVRFALAAAMIGYGAAKLIPAQMIPPWPDKLLQPIGDASPMGLVWTFMGASASYMVFTGVAEMLGGLLLVFRRTTLLGALVCIGAMSNVVMINFSYDVPVKLYSSHLLLMAVFLAAPDLQRLANLLVLNRRVPPAESRPLFAVPVRHRAALILRAAFVLFITWASLRESYKDFMQYGALAPKPRLYGIWEVEELAVDGVNRPLLATDETLWRRLIFEWPGTIAIQHPHETETRYYQLKPDPGPHMFALTKLDDPKWQAGFSYKLVGADVLTLESQFEGKQIRGRYRRMDDSRFRLISRGFQWINEWPYNR
jgi:hypothetical protein